MKAFILVALLGLLTFMPKHTLSASDQENVTIKQAVLIVTGGNFSPDHLGPDKYEAVKNIILNNTAVANQIMLSEILNHEEYTSRLSSLHIGSVLNLTSQHDRKGMLQVAKLYQKALDDGLSEFDGAANKDVYLQSKSEQDKNKIQRLVQRRNELKGLVEGTQQ
ncbi:MAG: hypothetical protein ACAI35_07150 [Candidatus Methylacidiphilales bacterium]|nr:hypothetical protein [Candidatus Methylacidiphilales bacterium]